MKKLLALLALTITATGAMAEGKTRAQVQAELAEAKRTGNIILNSEMHITEREFNPSAFPGGKTESATKTRAQVQAELKKAHQDGTLHAMEKSGG